MLNFGNIFSVIELTTIINTVFLVSGPLLWNSLPTPWCIILTLTQFCARLKTFLFSRAHGTSS